MRIGYCKLCRRKILYLDTTGHIQFGGMSPPVQKDDLCPRCWVKKNPKTKIPSLPGWHNWFKK